MLRLREKIEGHIYGQNMNVRLLLIAFLAGGHVLLEGVPGLGKTKMVRMLARYVDGTYKRVQFTPDMMPSDVIGNVVFNMQEHRFETMHGPVFTNLLLADEINRTPPKTQAALLEAMEERQVTIQGTTYPLPDPFFVVATQNPVEYEGTYPLPEAQLDRFLFKLIVDYPSAADEHQILYKHVPFYEEQEQQIEPVYHLEELCEMRKGLSTVNAEASIIEYITSLVRTTREHHRLQLGASPRAGLAILMASKALALLENRTYVTPDDVKFVAPHAFRNRLVITPQVELEGGTVDSIVQEIMASIQVPR